MVWVQDFLRDFQKPSATWCSFERCRHATPWNQTTNLKVTANLKILRHHGQTCLFRAFSILFSVSVFRVKLGSAANSPCSLGREQQHPPCRAPSFRMPRCVATKAIAMASAAPRVCPRICGARGARSRVQKRWWFRWTSGKHGPKNTTLVGWIPMLTQYFMAFPLIIVARSWAPIFVALRMSGEIHGNPTFCFPQLPVPTGGATLPERYDGGLPPQPEVG